MERGISQWTVSTRLHYHLRNIQRIENGTRQPGVTLALRLVTAVGVNPGDFFQSLFEEIAESLSCGEVLPTSRVEVAYWRPELEEEVKCLFGPLLTQARLAGGVSQTAMAKQAGYNLRNVNAVEKGKQEPGVVSALCLVVATGADIRSFFHHLHEFSTIPSEE